MLVICAIQLLLFYAQTDYTILNHRMWPLGLPIVVVALHQFIVTIVINVLAVASWLLHALTNHLFEHNFDACRGSLACLLVYQDHVHAATGHHEPRGAAHCGAASSR